MESDLDLAIVKAVYEAKGQKIEKGTFGFPSEDPEFQRWCEVANSLVSRGFLLSTEVSCFEGNTISLTACVSSKGALAAS